MNIEIKYTPAERRRERQRQHILKMADELYMENGSEDGGFENTTVEMIAERSDISLRTFFRYFESKLDVIYLDSSRAVEDLERFTKIRLETETPLMAVVNGRLDQLKFFCQEEQSKRRFIRSLKAHQFRDRLSTMRGNFEEKMSFLLASHFAGSKAERMKKARLTAGLASAITLPLIHPDKLKNPNLLDKEVRRSIEMAKSMLEAI